jgi:ureidoglycolate dehydrogenase (NAD+)
MTGSEILIANIELKTLVSDIFVAANVEADNAERWAEILVWANLRGVDSHGVLRVPRYVEQLDEGSINPRPVLNVERKNGAVSVVDADHAPGPVGMCFAMDQAIECATKHHLGWCVVRNTTHTGAIGYYALQAARQGLAAIVMTASSPLMAYPGTTVPTVSTNPLAIAVPGGEHPPLLLDMSSAVGGRGKILRAIENKESVPADWGLDSQGKRTTDPNEVVTLLPLGGAKGAGLSLMIECFTSLMAGNPLIEPVLIGRKHNGRPMNGLAVAVDIAQFTDPDQFRSQVDALASVITSLPKASGIDQIFAPGERGDAILAERTLTGIPLPSGTWTKLESLATRFAIPLPEVS